MKGEKVLLYNELVIFQYTTIKFYLLKFFTANIPGLCPTLISLEHKLRKQNEQIQQTRV